MSLAEDRTTLEKSLVRALSRTIGYTTGAYDLDRIVSVLDALKDKASVYEPEIVDILKQRDSELTTSYLSSVLEFASAFGLIQLSSGRDARLQKVAASELGRSLNGARHARDKAFYDYFLAKVVFLADADSLVAILLSFKDGKPKSLKDTYSEYIDFLQELRTKRLDWLKQIMPERVIRERIEERVPWLKKSKDRLEPFKIEKLTQNTARHHTLPKRGWLKSLGMLSDEDALTDVGQKVLQNLMGQSGYFWIAPRRGTQERLGIPRTQIKEDVCEDDLIFAPDLPPASAVEVQEMAEDLYNVMVRGFPHAKLIHAPQASLILPIEYINFRSIEDGMRYSAEQVLREVFQKNKSSLDRMSAFRGNVGFYRVK